MSLPASQLGYLLLLGVITLERLFELWLSRRNARRALAPEALARLEAERGAVVADVRAARFLLRHDLERRAVGVRRRNGARRHSSEVRTARAPR